MCTEGVVDTHDAAQIVKLFLNFQKNYK
jgi:hypothetical protein